MLKKNTQGLVRKKKKQHSNSYMMLIVSSILPAEQSSIEIICDF